MIQQPTLKGKRRRYGIGPFLFVVIMFGSVIVPSFFDAAATKNERAFLMNLMTKYPSTVHYKNTATGVLLGRKYNRCVSLTVHPQRKLEADFFESIGKLQHLRHLDLNGVDVDEMALKKFASNRVKVLIVQEKKKSSE